jgi:hypothetical protein
MGLLDLLKSLAGIEQWRFSDRRSALRIPCEIGCRLKDKSGPPQTAVIVDIGLRGLRLMVPGKLRKGALVELASPSSQERLSVKCRVEWKKADNDGVLAGVSFLDSEEVLSRSWLVDELKAIGAEAVRTAQRRGGVRVICDADVKVIWKGDRANQRQGVMRDMGVGGTLLECPGPVMKLGDPVRLDFGPIEELAKMAVNGEIVAVYDMETPRYGVRFDTFSMGGVTDLERYLTYHIEKVPNSA